MSELLWWHRAGQRVVCRNDVFDEPHENNMPIRGKIYTIREILFEPYYGRNAVTLVEIRNTPRYYWNSPHPEQTFCLLRFAPLPDSFIKSLSRLLLSTPDDVRRCIEEQEDA